MLHLRTCVYHPNERAIQWSGHVHLTCDDKINIIAGLCKPCVIRERNNGSYHEGKCQGCYGSIEVSR